MEIVRKIVLTQKCEECKTLDFLAGYHLTLNHEFSDHSAGYYMEVLSKPPRMEKAGLEPAISRFLNNIFTTIVKNIA